MQDLAAKLQEDLQTTTHNYETQLSIMSEHLANMNDKLTVQRDEIDQLKYQLTNKVSTLYPSSSKYSFNPTFHHIEVHRWHISGGL
jgi:exonuclease VII large subunit